jgi:hypothetical protein
VTGVLSVCRAKQTNFEAATRIPLIVHVPGQVGGGERGVSISDASILTEIYLCHARSCQFRN